MNVATVTALLVAVTGLVTALTALYHAVTARRAVTAITPQPPSGSPAGPPSPGGSPR